MITFSRFAIDKIMTGLKSLRQAGDSSGPLVLDAPESPVAPAMEVVDENDEMELSSPGPEDHAAAEAVAETPIVIKSCTVWLGHLPKGVSESELKKVMAEYGAVSTLDLIPSRGCACKLLKLLQVEHIY